MLNPVLADLLKERQVFGYPPFTRSGLDFFGPLYVSVKRLAEKCWGFVSTCLTTRAIQFEVVPSMDTSSCVKGIERFVPGEAFRPSSGPAKGQTFLPAKNNC